MRSDDVYAAGARDEAPEQDELRAQDEPMSDEPMSDEPMSDEPMSDEPMSDEPTSDERRSPRGAVPMAGDGAEAPVELFGTSDVDRFRVEWREVQATFVDDPQAAVRGADRLVSEVMDSLTETFKEHKHQLEGQWQQGDEAETEGLRQALRSYRAFFDQLLKT
jgi:hypothetical protein